MAMQMAVSYITYDTSSREKPRNIIMFTQLEDGDLLSETCNDTESCNNSDKNSTLAPLICEEEMDVMSSGNEYDAEPMSTDMFEDIIDGSQSHPRINRR